MISGTHDSLAVQQFNFYSLMRSFQHMARLYEALGSERRRFSSSHDLRFYVLLVQGSARLGYQAHISNGAGKGNTQLKQAQQ